MSDWPKKSQKQVKKSPKIEPTADAWCQLTRARCCRYESGVHRVQRVPSTESKGRVHTSTASVVVMPEPTEVDRHINDGDLRIGALLRSGSAPHCAHAARCLAEVFRASGAGGQHVNTTESAVRVTHIPTGITASIQDERSQHQNKSKALALIAARVYEARRMEEAEVSCHAHAMCISLGLSTSHGSSLCEHSHRAPSAAPKSAPATDRKESGHTITCSPE